MEGVEEEGKRAWNRIVEQQIPPLRMAGHDEVDCTRDSQAQDTETTHSDQTVSRFTPYQHGRCLVDIDAFSYGTTASDLVNLYHNNPEAFGERVDSLSGLCIHFNHLVLSWKLKLVS